MPPAAALPFRVGISGPRQADEKAFMAQVYYSLEEAADKLGMGSSEFKKRLRTEWTHIKGMRDGSTLRFKAEDVEELARQIGFGSEEELQLVDPSSDEAEVPQQLKKPSAEPPKSGKQSSGKLKKPVAKDDSEEVLRLTESELNLGDKEVFLTEDDEPPAKKSSGKIRPGPAKGDSDVRLEKSGKIKKPTKEEAEPTDEVELDILPQGGSSSKLSGSGKMTSSSSSKLSSASSGKLAKTSKTPPPSSPAKGLSSEFELSLESGSSDEFELSLASDSSDEISLGDMPKPSASDSKVGLSGINIGKPKDAGVSLEKKGGDSGRSSKKLPGGKPAAGDSSSRSSKKLPAVKPGANEDVDFELSLDQPGASSKKLGSSKKLNAAKKLDSDSEFDLTLDGDDKEDALTTSFAGEGNEDEPKNDIFETDFEIPALDDDSASEAVAVDEADTDLESSSDFDLAIDDESDVNVEEDSGSQVVVLDDEIEAQEVEEDEAPRKSKKKKKVVEEVEEDAEADGPAVSFDDMDLEENLSASAALKGVRGEEIDEDEEERTVEVSGAPWGVLPAILLVPTVFVIFLGGLMAYEMMHSMWGYHQPNKPTTLVIDNVADMLDMKPKDDITAPAAK